MGVARKTRWLNERVSLRLRLTLWMVVISIVLQGSLALVVLIYQRGSIESVLLGRVQVRATAIADGVQRREFQVTDEDLSRLVGEMLRFSSYGRIVAALYDADGACLASNARPAPALGRETLAGARPGAGTYVTRDAVPGFTDAAKDSRSLRLLVRRMVDPTGRHVFLFLATNDPSYDEMLALTGRVVLLTALVGIGGASLAAWMIAGLASTPLHQLRRLAGSLSPEGIEQEDLAIPSSSPEQIAVMRELEDVRSRLREALHAQDRFISNVSHELKTPIAVLLTEAQTVDPRPLPDEPRRFIQSVTEEMRRLGRMVEGFLTLTKVRGGMKLASVQRRSVNDIVMEAVGSCTKMARQYGVVLAPELSEDDPNVSGDSELLRVMLDNLIHNAIQFSQDGQHVRVRVAAMDQECHVYVRDLGPGVPEDMKEKLFERFVQGPGEVRGGRNYGLGLSIAQGIAELHGGRISVENGENGVGCEFTVRLPLAVDAPVSEPVG